jgi:hypothetical protein
MFKKPLLVLSNSINEPGWIVVLLSPNFACPFALPNVTSKRNTPRVYLNIDGKKEKRRKFIVGVVKYLNNVNWLFQISLFKYCATFLFVYLLNSTKYFKKLPEFALQYAYKDIQTS